LKQQTVFICVTTTYSAIKLIVYFPYEIIGDKIVDTKSPLLLVLAVRRQTILD